MSTRCNIVVRDNKKVKISDEHSGWGYQWFYRHSDGYPEGALPLLKRFMKLVKDKKLRDNTEQSASWLILLGNADYAKDGYSKTVDEILTDEGGQDYLNSYRGKVGAIEVTAGKHGDIEHLYILNLEELEIEHEDLYTGKKKIIKL